METKKSAITYAGYDYQTLQGVLQLALWLNNPTAYKRICLEADQDNTPQGVDDIVLERNDGKTDYIQVKFTPSPYKEINYFSWDWLLKKTGTTDRSRSILNKIFDAVQEIDIEKRGTITLLTNKIPSKEIENCLNGDTLNYDLIDDNTQTYIIEQLGSEDIARNFFEILQIKHSDKSYEALVRTIQSELAPHANDEGIYRLIIRAGEWAKFKNQPTEDGWIELHHIREILSSRRAQPISQAFYIPEGYCLPDKDFHEFILNKISHSLGEIISITGDPGKGKSTYLSYLHQSLEEIDIPVIRHHYFLSIKDNTHDRLNFRVVAESLLSQISINHKNIQIDDTKAENLNSCLKKCAEYYKTQGKPFVLIVDGLDHVWRDNHNDIKPLDYFFKELLPVPDNLVLLVGTQPVDDKLLPNILLYHSPKCDWHDLPSMTGNAILEYLNHQVNSKRLYLTCHKKMIEEELKKSAEALVEITSGYPLHIIYSCEFIANSGKPLSHWIIKELPPCQNSHIENYYQGLWRDLTHKQKDVLHLCCGLPFIWPRNIFAEILNDDLQKPPSINAIAHLLLDSKSGLSPFHESLIVFVKKQDDHNERILIHINNVCLWLKNQAPEYLNQTWFWLCKSIAGDDQPLREGLTREWVIKRLSEGYDTQVIIKLLEKAEKIAFSEFDYSEAYSHRALKTRLYNGPEFQIWNLPLLKILSLNIAPISLIDFEISSYHNYTPKNLAILSIALWYRSDFDNAKRIAHQAISKHHSQIKLYHKRNSDDETIELLIQAGVLSNELNYENLLKKGGIENWTDKNIKTFITNCLLKSDIGLLIKTFDYLSEYEIANEIELSLLRASIIEGFDIFAWQEFQTGYAHPASELLMFVREKKFNSIKDEFYKCNEYFPYKLPNEINYSKWFFEAIIIKLKAKGNFSWLHFQAENIDGDISFYLNKLTELASILVEEIITENQLNFYTCSSLLQTLSFPDNNYRMKRTEILFKREWLKISADLHLLMTQNTIDFYTLNLVIEDEVYLLDWIRLWYTEVTLNMLSEDATNLLIEKSIEKQSTELEETNERSNNNLELAYIAFRHNHVDTFKKCITLCWNYVLSYGHHKDTTIFNVLDSIKYLSNNYPIEALTFLQRIAPIIFNISNFTDGDETRHSLSEMANLLARLNAPTLVSKYNQEIHDGEWYDADDSLSKFLKNSDFDQPITKRLCLTGLPHECYKTITDKAREGNDSAKLILDEIKNLLNMEVIEKTLEENNKAFDKDIDIDPSLYPPNKLEELNEALKARYGTRKFWVKWYEFWVIQGKEQELIEVLPIYLSSNKEDYSDIACLYDYLFNSVKKFKGKREAYKYIVAAQINMKGWYEWYGYKEDSINRLKIIATIYQNQINQFILDTTTETDIWNNVTNNLIIPNDKLVYLLAESGNKEAALKLTNAIVTDLEEITSNLNLTPPNWIWDTNYDTNRLTLDVLVSRLKWPVPSIKVLVSKHLSELLIELPEITETVLLKALKSCKQESECIEILSVILMAKDIGYEPNIEIGKFINARSTLSDMIIKELSLTEKGNYSTTFRNFIVIQENNHGFDKIFGTHVPLIYRSTLEKEEQRTKIPFTEYYQSEWNRTFEYAQESNDSIDYFFASERQYTTGQFYTNTSHRGRSAYLRVIEIAKHFYDMPESYAEHLATIALPIELVYNRLEPHKPVWINDWTYGDHITEENLKEYLSQCIFDLEQYAPDNELGAMSFPFQINENSWLELTIVKAAKNGEDASNLAINERNAIAIGEKLNREIKYFSFDLENTGAIIEQLTGSTLPKLRYGHFYSDLEARGVYIPLTYDQNKIIQGVPNKNKMQFQIDDFNIGEFGYWYYKWEPTHPQAITSLCGCYTILSKENISYWMHNKFKGLPHVYICKASLLSRDRIFTEYTKIEQYFTIDISDSHFE